MVYNFFVLAILQVLFMGMLQDSYPDEMKAILNMPEPIIESYSGDKVKYEEALTQYYLDKKWM